MVSQSLCLFLFGARGAGGWAAADDGSGDAAAERLSRELDAQQLCNHVWIDSPAAAAGGGGGGALRCALVRRGVLRSLAGEAGLGARLESFSDYLDRRIRPPADPAALRWACEAVGLRADALDCPLDAGVHAALSLFYLVTFQRMVLQTAPVEVLQTVPAAPPLAASPRASSTFPLGGQQHQAYHSATGGRGGRGDGGGYGPLAGERPLPAPAGDGLGGGRGRRSHDDRNDGGGRHREGSHNTDRWRSRSPQQRGWTEQQRRSQSPRRYVQGDRPRGGGGMDQRYDYQRRQGGSFPQQDRQWRGGGGGRQ
jgi:hypothetical protein